MPEPTTKVRVAVVVGPDGSYQANGWSNGKPSDMHGIAADCLETDEYAAYWLEADVPIPIRRTIRAKVSEA